MKWNTPLTICGAAWTLMFFGCQMTNRAVESLSLLDCSVHTDPTVIVFLIGDAGDPELPQNEHEARGAGRESLVDPVLSALASDVNAAADKVGAEQTLVLYLGDNIYPKGLPPPGVSTRERARRIIDAQVAAVGPARGIFVPGNHDWERWGDDGWTYLREQEQYVERQAPRIVMEPSGGCPGPTHLDVGSQLRLLFIDPAALTAAGDGLWAEEAQCPRRSAEGVLEDLTVEFRDFDGRNVILATHYPIITGGPHGGHFTWREHIFPLTDFFPWAWIPMPVIGSVYPVSRMLGVTATDQMNNDYRGYMEVLLSTKGPEAPVLVAAGHDHSLQVHRSKQGRFHVVSGAGSASKVDRVMDLDTSLMSMAAPGYMRLDSYDDGGLELTVTAIDDNRSPREIYRTCIVDRTEG